MKRHTRPPPPQSRPWKLIAVGAWLLATYALAGWWLVFGLRQVERLSLLLDSDAAAELARQHRMLMSEGAALFALLFVGGAGLLWSIWLEIGRARQVREFFAAFTHDLKTSLASLRLQAESLQEDQEIGGRDPAQAKVLRRLTKDTVRLELQLENSLFLSSPDAQTELYYENLRIEDSLERARHQWPELTIEAETGITARADRRALESIIKNLIQNSVVHGKAKCVRLRRGVAESPDRAVIEIEDDGVGFSGDVSELGTMFRRHAPTSGSGIGLPLSMRLAKQMGGSLLLHGHSGDRGFAVRLELAAVSGLIK